MNAPLRTWAKDKPKDQQFLSHIWTAFWGPPPGFLEPENMITVTFQIITTTYLSPGDWEQIPYQCFDYCFDLFKVLKGNSEADLARVIRNKTELVTDVWELKVKPMLRAWR